MARTVAVLFATAIAAGVVVLYLFDPSAATFFPRCLFHALSGLQCPGCGLTRALHHVLHGRWAEAFRLNAFGVVFAPLLLAGAVSETRYVLRGPSSTPRLVEKPWIAWVAFALIVSWGIGRNLMGV